MAPPSLAPVEEMVARLERALAGSPADETELVWLEARRSLESNRQESNGRGRRDSFEAPERSLLVRVRVSGRTGLHRTGQTGLAELEKAVREALAQARLAAPTPPPRLPEGAGDPLPQIPGLYDPEIPRLTPARVKELIQKTADRGEVARLGWGEGRLAVVNSRGLRRAVLCTAAWIDVACARAPGAGHAAGVSRSLAGLDGLDVAAVVERARRRDVASAGAGAEEAPPAGPLAPLPVALAPEAAAVLIDLLNRHALSSLSFLDGVSFLCERTGQEVFHPSISLRDDPLDPRGAPFPCDLLGAAKRPLEIVRNGVFLAPVRDERLAQLLDLRPTAHLAAPDEARAGHLALVPALAPNSQPDAELLRQAEGGLWVSALDPVEVFDPYHLRFRAVARGVRRITGGGALGAALPDLVWEGDLPALLSAAGVLGVGAEAVAVASVSSGVSGVDPLFGAVSAPLLALAAVAGLRPEPTPRS
jgi:predicted Zn-dependent protease